MELFSVYGIFFKNMLRKLDFERIGRNFFNPKEAKHLTQFNIEVWPGFFSAMNKVEIGPYIQIDITNKVVRKDTLLQDIENMSDKNMSNEAINEKVANIIVVTSYTKKTYRISHLDFTKNPSSTFEVGKGEEVVEKSFSQYYKEKYGV